MINGEQINADLRVPMLAEDETNGIALRYFLEVFQSAVDTAKLAVKMPSGAGVMKCAVAADTMTAAKSDGTKGIPVDFDNGNVVEVYGDGDVEVGDFVTNDAEGLATTAAATGTPANYNVHGLCVGIKRAEAGAVKQVCLISLKSQQIYM